MEEKELLFLQERRRGGKERVGGRWGGREVGREVGRGVGRGGRNRRGRRRMWRNRRGKREKGKEEGRERRKIGLQQSMNANQDREEPYHSNLPMISLCSFFLKVLPLFQLQRKHTT